ncbi:MAG: hypothetical protein KQH57_11870 [Actinomycetales bacterium]|nr:hypothetical protein [Actinomycetales bacterium]
MSERFDSGLRELGERIGREHDDVWDDWTAQMTARVRRGRRVRTAALAGGLVAALGVVAFGGSMLDRRPAPVPPATTLAPSPTRTSAPTPTPTSAPTSSSTPTSGTTAPLTGVDVVAGWRELGVDPALFGDAVVTDAASVGGTVVAVGCDAQAHNAGSTAGADAPIWTGVGSTWTRVGPIDSPLPDQPVDCLSQVVATPHGFFAVAWSALLHSDDGLTWSPVEVLPAPEGYPLGNYVAAAVWGDRVTVVTQRLAGAESMAATLWTTTDGTTWQELGAGIPHDTAGVGDNPGVVFDNANLSRIVDHDGVLVAVGASPGGEFVPTAAAWTSTDALTWTPATVEAADQCSLTDVVETGSGLLGVGSCASTGNLAAWESSDGRSWRRVSAPHVDLDPDTALVGVAGIATIGDRVAISARHFDAAAGTDAAVQWVGSPETGWERADDLAIPYLQTSELGFWPITGVATQPRVVLTQQP